VERRRRVAREWCLRAQPGWRASLNLLTTDSRVYSNPFPHLDFATHKMQHARHARPPTNRKRKRLRPQVEIPLPLPYRYHSIFACPVSKEQSTAQNPPMLLPCGHVIARESLMRLARGTP
jgi:hypothetical protein